MNPIQRAIREMFEAIQKELDALKSIGENEVITPIVEARITGIETGIDILRRNLKDAAMVDVKKSENKCYLYSPVICNITGYNCHGLGNDGCPAYVTKGADE
jgi:acyl-CoA reductase-like NAD-dependent aldehyde dehydrogenase